MPLATRYDPYERVTSEPQPFLFQRTSVNAPRSSIPDRARRTPPPARCPGSRAPPTRRMSVYPHDFRRLFATDLVNNGLPIHIGAALLGHLDLQTTRGYVAVFNEDVVRHYQAFLARPRARATGRRVPAVRRENGPSSKSTSTSAKSSSATAAGPTAPPASTNTPASAARCSTSTPRCSTASTRSRPTSIARASTRRPRRLARRDRRHRPHPPPPRQQARRRHNDSPAPAPPTSESLPSAPWSKCARGLMVLARFRPSSDGPGRGHATSGTRPVTTRRVVSGRQLDLAMH